MNKSEKRADFSARIRPSKKSRWDFLAEHPHCPHSLTAKLSVRTVVRIEVFFAPAELGQKTD
ncbi:MAG: hypothetical protein J6A19_07945, partial [Oscillospiraceae bacterium]|nr:hypothetical protein [Oscillospiraceae bacterium]